MLKRIFSLLLCLVMFLSMMPAKAIAQETAEEPTEPVLETEDVEPVTEPAESEVETLYEAVSPACTATGVHEYVDTVCIYCGAIGGKGNEYVNWRLEEDTLIISGTGEMPWHDMMSDPTDVWWNAYADQITTLIIEEGITDIEYYAFSDLKNLTSVTIADSVKSIGIGAFVNCDSLKQISLPDSIEFIEREAFLLCDSLEQVDLPNSITEIAYSTFAYCGSLQEIEIPETVEKIDDYVFLDTDLKQIIIPDQVKILGTAAFEDCAQLEEVHLSSNIMEIPYYAFADCTGLQEIAIPENVQYIGGWAFHNSGLRQIEIPDQVTILDRAAFAECMQLEQVTLGSGVTCIQDYAFRGCNKLEKLVLPESLEKLGDLAFCDSGLKEIHFQGSAPEFGYNVFSSLTAVAYYPAGDPTWTESVRQNYGGTITWVAVDEMSIKETLRQLVEVRDEMTLEEIRAAVQELDFDKLLTAMRNDTEVIEYLSVLGGYSEVTITKDVPIWNTSFHSAVGLSLNNIQNEDPVCLDKPVNAVDIPDSYNSDAAIHFSVNMDSLGDDRVLSVPVCIDLVAPEGIHPNFLHIFWRNPETNVTEEIPVVAYWSKVGWCVQFVVASEGDYVMAAPEDTVMIGRCGTNLTWRYDDTYTLTISGSGAMYDYDLDTNKIPWYSVRENVHHIEIGENVTGIGAYAFYDCRFADKTVIPASVECIDEYAFYGMNEQVFYFEGNAPEIADTAFYHAEYSTIYYHADKEGWLEIISKTFVEADDLEWIPIPEESDSCGENLTWRFDEVTGTLTISGSGAMYNTWWPYQMRDELPSFAPWHGFAEDIRSVVIESDVISIGHFAFFDCVNLTSVSIPESVTFVGCAFVGCDSLKELYIPASVTDFCYPTNEGICNGLEKIVVAEGNAVYSSDEAGMLYNKDKTKLIGCPTGYKGSYSIPDGVTTIGEWSFNACSGLTSVGIPVTVENIGTAAFSGCEKLDGVVIPEGVTTIPMWAFYGCAELTEIIIPAGVTTLGSGGFAECASLEAVYFEGDAPDIAYDCFDSTITTAYYPAGNDTWSENKREDYCGKIQWMEYSNNKNTCGDNLTWEFDGSTGKLTISGTGVMYDYTGNDDGVNYPWAGCAIEQIYFDEGVTSVGDYAFYGIKNLTNVYLPETMESIGAHAFENCSKLEDAWLVEEIARIGEYAFAGCSRLYDAYVPEKVTVIHEGVFRGCTKIDYISLPDGLIEIGDYAFEGCEEDYLVLPSQVTRLGVRAFAENEYLSDVTIPANVTALGAQVFRNCTDLETIKFQGDAPVFEKLDGEKTQDQFVGVAATVYYPADNDTWTETVMQQYGGRITWVAYNTVITGTCGTSVTWAYDEATRILTISGSGAMENYADDDSGILPMPWAAYLGDTERIVVEEGVTAVGNYAFYGSGATEVKLPNSLISIGDYAFAFSRKIPEFIIPGSVRSIGSSAFMACTISEMILPDGLTYLGESAFSGCSDLKAIDIPAGLTEISSRTFVHTGLTSITIPGTVRSIGEAAFEHCHLESITISEGVTSIGDWAFYWTELTEVMLPDTITDIGMGAFYDTKLTAITIPSSVTYIGPGAFDCSTLEYIEVDEANASYMNDTYGVLYNKNRTTLVACPSGYQGAFSIPNTVTRIEDRAFSGCAGLTQILIPQGVTYIGELAFSNCFGLTEVVIPDGVTTLGEGAFSSCTSLATISISSSITSLPDSVFSHTALTGFFISDSITSIGEYAFSSCDELVEITIPDSVTYMGDCTFYYCNNLEKVVFEGSAPEFGKGTNASRGIFSGVTATVYYPEGDPSWTEDVRQDYDGEITWIAQEESEAEYTYSQNVQIKLIEPWGIRANAKISTAEGVVDYNGLYDYGVYFIRKSALDREGLSQSTITVEDIVNDADARKQTKADGVIVSSGYLSAIYDRDIYTYELEDSVFVMFYFVTEEGADPIYVPIRERNLEELVQQRKNDAASFPNELERTVYQKMTKLEEDVADYRSDFANLSAPETQKAPTLAQYPLGPQAAGSQYTYGQNAQIKLIEPWGLKANVKVSKNGSVINYNNVEEYGIVALADNSRVYTTAAEILENGNAYVFSSKNGDATISNGYISATYSKDIFTYQLNTDIYVFGYVKDADGYHYGPVRNRNVHTLMEARMNDAVNFPNVKERTVYADMINLYTAITDYREDYFKN